MNIFYKKNRNIFTIILVGVCGDWLKIHWIINRVQQNIISLRSRANTWLKPHIKFSLAVSCSPVWLGVETDPGRKF